MRDPRAINSRHSSNPGRALSRIGMALALLMAGAGSAQAQSLQELYDAARAFDAQFLSARALADSAQYKAAQADALARPSLGLGVTAKRDETDPPKIGRVGASTLSAGLQGKYALYNPGNKLTIAQAQLGLTVAQADLESAEQDLIVRVAQAYFDVLGAQDVLGTARASKAMISEQLASAKRNFEVGTQTITDTREAQARYDLALATEIAAENDLRIKSVTLDQLVGRNGVTPKPLAVPVALPAVTPLTVDPWVAQAEEMHPLIRKARIGLDVAKLEIGKARAADGVTVDLNGTLGAQDARGSGAQLKGTTGTASLGVTLSLPLYTGGATQNRIKETLALEEKSRNDLDYARRAVSEGTKRAFFGVQSLTAQVKALEAAESSSKLALEATQLGYKVGVRVNLDVLNAQTQLFNTQQNLAKARYDVVMTSLKLRQASGQLKPDDVSAVNQLLAK
ncbi:TolC family outer membrane protein [Paucibacter sp. DJ2R-2]|uniref:TolC family outer membrane protein n=1 Tax=Paucibacter sp. DJ2R-2 TaxID=2893558 RepID=UPI0021E40217|nr:TolC family outer membrane protein [Paucibacter sp. DJ2R-2]MCV2423143.1 TolC family outer membrane protein [Paucibacter sp. DJ4R-1]MCV2440599.1 TolC family outer membrane protein [Paucibacter sp. DJ2R-2]